jgi:hypothetical protein
MRGSPELELTCQSSERPERFAVSLAWLQVLLALVALVALAGLLA